MLVPNPSSRVQPSVLHKIGSSEVNTGTPVLLLMQVTRSAVRCDRVKTTIVPKAKLERKTWASRKARAPRKAQAPRKALNCLHKLELEVPLAGLARRKGRCGLLHDALWIMEVGA